MWMIGPLGFAAPLILLALVALPVLWIVLRAVPPASGVRYHSFTTPASPRPSRGYQCRIAAPSGRT